MSSIQRFFSRQAVAVLVLGCAAAQAAEGFNVRLSGGTVGRELFAPSVPGHYGTLNLVYYNTTKIKGDDGGCFAAALAAVRKWGDRKSVV